MNGSNLWRGPESLLELFSVDASRPGAQDWIALVWLYATALRYPEGNITLEEIARGFMREERFSPVVFWGRIKRELRPLLEADAETLLALGLDPRARTGRGFAASVAAALAAATDWKCERSDYEELARALGRR